MINKFVLIKETVILIKLMLVYPINAIIITN